MAITRSCDALLLQAIKIRIACKRKLFFLGKKKRSRSMTRHRTVLGNNQVVFTQQAIVQAMTSLKKCDAAPSNHILCEQMYRLRHGTPSGDGQYPEMCDALGSIRLALLRVHRASRSKTSLNKIIFLYNVKKKHLSSPHCDMSKHSKKNQIT